MSLKYASESNHLNVVKYLIPKMDPQYVINKLPGFTKYLGPEYSHIGLADKFGVFDEEI